MIETAQMVMLLARANVIASCRTIRCCSTPLIYPDNSAPIVSLHLKIPRFCTVNQGNAKPIEPTPDAEAEWVQTVNRPNPMTKYQSICTPGYYNGSGISKGGLLQAVYADDALAFFDLLARRREKEDSRADREMTAGRVVGHLN